MIHADDRWTLVFSASGPLTAWRRKRLKKNLEDLYLKVHKRIRFGYKIWCLNTMLGYLIQFQAYRWHDNSPVTIASNVYGVQPVDKAKRWSNATKKEIQVTQPAAVK